MADTPRLPQPGQDAGRWGEILNQFLAESHHDDGSLKTASVTAAIGDGVISDRHVSTGASISQSKINGLSTDLSGKLGLASFTTKGDIVAATGAGAISRLGAGTDGQVLTVDPSQATGLVWETLSTTDGTAVHKGDFLFNAADYNIPTDGKRLHGAVASSGSASVTVSSASFVSGDVGKIAVVYHDSGAGTVTTIQSVQSSTQITLAAAAGITTTSSNGVIAYGSNCSTALQNVLNAAATHVSIPAAFFTNPNQPMASGLPRVVLAATSSQGLYMLGSAVTIPSGVFFDGDGMLFNALADRFEPCILINQYTWVRRLSLDAGYGNGVKAGTANQQAHIWMGDIRLWHIGQNTEATGLLRNQDGIELVGYHFEINNLFVKGGVRGVYHNPGSDCAVGYAYLIGSKTGAHLNASNQVSYATAFVDSCKGVNTPYGGIVIDNGCSNVYVNAQAFEVIGVTSSCSPVIAIGQINTAVNKDISIDFQANNTGGTALAIANAQDVMVKGLVSNAVFASGINNPITTAIAYGTNLLGTIQIDANISASVTPFTGTISGTLRYSQGGTFYSASPMSTSNVTVKPAANSTSALQVQNTSSTVVFDVDNANNRVGINTASPDQALTINNGNLNLRMAPITGVSATPSGSGGSLASGTYYYQIVGVDGAGGTTVASSEVSAVVTGPNGLVSLSWTASTSASSYRIYRGTTSGGENAYYVSSTNSFTDTGAASTAGSVPSPSAAAVKLGNNANSWITGGNVGIGTAAPTATLALGGSFALNRRGISDANYTLTSSDYMVAYTTLTAPRTVTLPTASASINGVVYIVKDQTGQAATHTITLATSSSQTIDGAAIKTITTAFGYVKVYTNGANWFTTV